MWLFTSKSKLLRELNKLAFYNDKGVFYSKHSASQKNAYRNNSVARIESLAVKLGTDTLPQEFISALKSGTLSRDATGYYFDLIKNGGS